MSKKRRERRQSIRTGDGAPLDYNNLWKDDDEQGERKEEAREGQGNREGAERE